MTNIYRSCRVSALLLAQAMFIGTVLLQGCSTPNRSGDISIQAPDPDFEKGANRPPTAKTLFAMADVLAAQGKDAEAEFVLRRFIREYPSFPQAYNSLAELQMRQRRIQEAIETISSGLAINPKDPVLLNNLGICWMVRRDNQNALEMFTKAAGIMPENARYRANMATVLGLMGRYEESLSLFRQILPEEQAQNNLNVLRQEPQIPTDS
jgi:Flp pilus assembly protein TadD